MRFFRYLLIFTGIGLLAFFSCQKSPEEAEAIADSQNFALSEDGCPIYFKVVGQGEISLIFVHDWCLEQSYWERQIPSFRVYYKVVTLDLAGHGRSGTNRKTWTMETYGKDVIAVVEQLDLDKVILIGHGMGGPVVLEAARSMPERVIGVVGAETFSDTYMERLSEEQIDYFLSAFRADFPEGVRQYALENFFRTKTDDRLKKRIVLDMAGVPSEVGISSLTELLRYDGSPVVRELTVPIRSINADMPIVTFNVIRSNAANFSLKFMAQVGHFLMMEDPNGFNRFLADFLGEIMLASYQGR